MHKTSLLVVATLATMISGHASRAQTVTLDASSKMGRQLICRAQWNADKDDVKKIEATKYGSQYYMKVCKASLEKKTAGVR